MPNFRPFVSVLAIVASAGLVVSLQSQQAFNFKVGTQPKSVDLTVSARDLSVSCPGGALRLGGSTGLKVGKVDRYGNSYVDVGQDLNASQQLQVKLAKSSRYDDLNVSKVSRLANSQGLNLIARDNKQNAPQSSVLLSAIQTQLLNGSTVSGLGAVTCQPAAAEQWLVGAETMTGRESILILQNSTDLDATANLSVFTEGGLLDSASLSGIVVNANDFAVVPLATLAPKAKTIAIQVKSSGGAITAWVQQKTTRGLANGGFDYIASQPEASTKLSIPGLFVRGAKKAEQLIASNSDYQDLVPSLHIFVPGNETATFTAQVISSTAGSFGTVIKQTVDANKIARFDIPGLADGDYSILIDSDQPIQATVNFSRVVGSKTDFAYLVPAQAETVKRALVAPLGLVTKLSLVNPGDQPAKVKLGGASQSEITLDRASAAQILVKAGSLVTVESDVAVAASLVLDASGSVAVANLLNYSNLPTKVSVLVR